MCKSGVRNKKPLIRCLHLNKINISKKHNIIMTEMSSSSETNTTATSVTSIDEQTATPHSETDYIAKLCQDMFNKTADFLNGEFESTADEYRLLEQMNRATLTKYTEMKDISTSISRSISDLNEKYSSLQPYLDMIDQVDESVAGLEQAAYKLDAYSKRLEAKFKQIERS